MNVSTTLLPVWSSANDASGRTEISERPSVSLLTVPSAKSPVLDVAAKASMIVQLRSAFQKGSLQLTAEPLPLKIRLSRAPDATERLPPVTLKES